MSSTPWRDALPNLLSSRVGQSLAALSGSGGATPVQTPTRSTGPPVRTPGRALGGSPTQHLASLSSVAKVFSELNDERAWLASQADAVFADRAAASADLRAIDKALDELTARKSELEATLVRITAREDEIRCATAELDAKLASIGHVSAGFESRVKTIKDAEPGGVSPAHPMGSLNDLHGPALSKWLAASGGAGTVGPAGGAGPSAPAAAAAAAATTGGHVVPRGSSASPTFGVSQFDAETGAFRVVSPEPSSSLAGLDVSTRTFYGHSASVAAVGIDAVRGAVVSGSGDGTVRVWNPESGTCDAILTGHESWVRAVGVSGSTLVSGSGDKTLRVWDVDSGMTTSVLTGHTGPVTSLQFSGSTLVSGSVDKSARVWDMESELEVLSLRSHSSYVSDLQFWQYGLATASGDGSVKIWDIRTGDCHRTLNGHTGGVLCLRFDANILYSGGTDRFLHAWDLRMGRVLDSVSPGGTVHSLAFAGSTLVAAAESPDIHVYNRSSLQPATPLRGHLSAVKALAIRSDGLVVSGAADANVKLWMI